MLSTIDNIEKVLFDQLYMVDLLAFGGEVPKNRDELQICDVVRGFGV